MKILMMILLQMMAVTLGDLSLSKGMKALGPAPVHDFQMLFSYGVRVFSNPLIGFGIVFLALSFFLWLIVLSKTDLSFALPMTAVGYILNAVAARIFLHEQVSLTRWAGTLVICLGVVIIWKGS